MKLKDAAMQAPQNVIAYQSATLQLRFAAHLAIVLQLHDRVDAQFVDKYNDILHWFIESVIVESKVKIDLASKVQSVPFYVAMMLGD